MGAGSGCVRSSWLSHHFAPRKPNWGAGVDSWSIDYTIVQMTSKSSQARQIRMCTALIFLSLLLQFQYVFKLHLSSLSPACLAVLNIGPHTYIPCLSSLIQLFLA